MKKFLTIIFIVFILSSYLVAQSQVKNNIALLSLGATAEDNGSFNDYGIDRDATAAIDGDSTTYWAGLQSNSPQMMWIYFDKEYNIDKIYINENPNAYINTGEIEYFDGTSWIHLYSINKSSSDLFIEFSPVKAKGVKITVNTLTAPSSWYNKVACLYSVEVNGKGTTSIDGQNKQRSLKKFVLYQNYPNPFNPLTNISFDLKKSSHVKIEIYNIQGRLIETLLDKPMSAGSHTIKFNGTNLASGIYFYRIIAGEFQQIKKMSLVK